MSLPYHHTHQEKGQTQSPVRKSEVLFPLWQSGLGGFSAAADFTRTTGISFGHISFGHISFGHFLAPCYCDFSFRVSLPLPLPRLAFSFSRFRVFPPSGTTGIPILGTSFPTVTFSLSGFHAPLLLPLPLIFPFFSLLLLQLPLLLPSSLAPSLPHTLGRAYVTLMLQ